jgi:GNAT superfamily N-acetyltransferase
MLQIVQIETAEQLQQYRALNDEFMAWDAEMTRALGQDIRDILHLYYKDPVSELPAEFAPPEGRMLLASYSGQTAGCGGLNKLAPNTGEIRRLYVRPAFRGKGIGRTLMETLIAEAGQIGYTTLRLHTTSFMNEAQALYHALGFKDIEAFRDVPDNFKQTEVFMELAL